MSEYNLFAGIDENYHFPPEVRLALLESLNIRNVGAPMTTAERNAIPTVDLDPGYYIFNTESQSFQIWRSDFEEWHEGLDAPGTVKEWPGAIIPPGWKKQDGSSLSRAIYFALFKVLGTTYGGSGTPTHFNLPNRGGRVTIDVTSGHHLGQQGGSETHLLSIAEMPSHNHGGATTGESNGHEHWGVTAGQNEDHYHQPFGGQGVFAKMPTGSDQSNYGPANLQGYSPLNNGGGVYGLLGGTSTHTSSGNHGHNFSTSGKNSDHTHAIYSQGGNNAHPIMQPYQAAHMLIKY